MLKYVGLFALCLLTINSCNASSAALWASAKATLSGLALFIFVLIVFIHWLDSDD